MIPPQRDAAFVAAMEAVLDVYGAPPDPRYPLVCFDESGKELQIPSRPPLPARSGRLARQDPEYVRGGSANLFLAYAPSLGWRHVTVTAQRTAIDWALAMRELVEVHFPTAERITVVLDNLNTHRLSSLYAAFPAAVAHRIAQRLTLCFTPRHGSWLNMAEVEFSVLKRQCLARRIADAPTLAEEVAAWAAARNAVAAPAQWRFSATDARTRLARLYPVPVCDT